MQLSSSTSLLNHPASALEDLQQALGFIQQGMQNVALSHELAVREREATRKVALERIDALLAANAQTAAQNRDLAQRVEELNARSSQTEDTHAMLALSESGLEETLQKQFEERQAAVLRLEKELAELEAKSAELEKLLREERMINGDRGSPAIMRAILGLRGRRR